MFRKETIKVDQAIAASKKLFDGEIIMTEKYCLDLIAKLVSVSKAVPDYRQDEVKYELSHAYHRLVVLCFHQKKFHEAKNYADKLLALYPEPPVQGANVFYEDIRDSILPRVLAKTEPISPVLQDPQESRVKSKNKAEVVDFEQLEKAAQEWLQQRYPKK